jgi:DNA-binding transcriptional regulator YhcF (GntR family)
MEFRQDQPIYLQIADLVSGNLLSGVWKPGDRVPSARDLAESLEVNPNTVVRTYAYLQEKGIIVNQRGVGYYVAKDAVPTTASLRKDDFVDRELPRVFQTMDLLGMDMTELGRLYADHQARRGKEARA